MKVAVDYNARPKKLHKPYNKPLAAHVKPDVADQFRSWCAFHYPGQSVSAVVKKALLIYIQLHGTGDKALEQGLADAEVQ